MANEILDQVDSYLKNAIANFNIKEISIKEEGFVVDINNSIAVIKGFTNIKSEECIIIKKKYLGIVSTVYGDTIKVMLLDKTKNIKIGDKVSRTYEPLRIPVGEEMIGRIIDGLGRPIDGKGIITQKKYLYSERPAKSIMEREAVSESLETGIKVIDSLIPVGRGQRELILGDKQTGKTAVAIDAILHQKNSDVICIYCSIGQRDNTVANVIKTLEEAGAMKYTIVVQASGNELAGHQFVAPYSATSIAEYFMEQGKHVLIIYDDLTKQARAYREISLLLEKNPGREAYPADIFYAHSRLLERSTKMRADLGGGSITSLPIIETEAENISAYIPTNVISITDGQIYMTPSLFQKGILPAIDIGKSVSRVGSSAQLSAYKQSVKTLGVEYSQFEELEMFSKFSTNLDDNTQQIINKGQRIRELLKQDLHQTYLSEEQLMIFFCVNEGIFDSVPLKNIKEAEIIIKNILHNDEFREIFILTRENKTLPKEIIQNFIFSVKDKLSKAPWTV